MNDELTPVTQLGRALSFSAEDLRANRSGRVTVRQRRTILRRFLSSVFVFLLLLLVPIGVGLILVAWGTEQSVDAVLRDDAALIGYLSGFALGLFYLTASLQQFLLGADLVTGRVLMISGPVERYGRYLYIGQKRFLLEAGELDLIQTELHYTLYVLPVSQHVLSLEFAE